MSAAAATNMFTTALAGGRARRFEKKGKVRRHAQVPGIEDLAAVRAVMKELAAVEKALAQDVKDQVLEEFLDHGPDTFEAHDNRSDCLCQLRKRSTRSPLTESEAAALEKAQVSVMEDQKARFEINKVYQEDEELLDRVSEALKEVEGIPEDFIKCQPVRLVTTEESIKEAYQNAQTEQDLLTLIDIVGCMVLNTKFQGNGRKRTLEILRQAEKQKEAE